MNKKVAKDIDALFAGPLHDFTSERNALAKKLRDAGKGDDADAVKALRKPTSAAAAVNQLALGHAKRVRAFYALTEKLRKATAGTIDPGKLRKLVRGEGEALEDLVGQAALDGAPKSVLDRVRETLQAGQVDPDLRDAIVSGRVEREQRSASVGLDNLVAPPQAPKRKSKAKTSKARKPKASDDRAAKAARERRVKAKSELARAKAETREAEREVARAEQSLAKAERTRDAATRRVERAEAKLAS